MPYLTVGHEVLLFFPDDWSIADIRRAVLSGYDHS
jgi:hypothetical protein